MMKSAKGFFDSGFDEVEQLLENLLLRLLPVKRQHKARTRVS